MGKAGRNVSQVLQFCAMRMMNPMNRVEIRRLLVRAVYKSSRQTDDPIIDQMVELFIEQQDFYNARIRQLQEAYQEQIKQVWEAFETEKASLRSEILRQFGAPNAPATE